MPKVIQFFVMGRGPFPLDMLRYERCWPTDQASVEIIRNSPNTDDLLQVSLSMIGDHQPTPARWNSYGWTVAATLTPRSRRVKESLLAARIIGVLRRSRREHFIGMNATLSCPAISGGPCTCGADDFNFEISEMIEQLQATLPAPVPEEEFTHV